MTKRSRSVTSFSVKMGFGSSGQREYISVRRRHPDSLYVYPTLLPTSTPPLTISGRGGGNGGSRERPCTPGPRLRPVTRGRLWWVPDRPDPCEGDVVIDTTPGFLDVFHSFQV